MKTEEWAHDVEQSRLLNLLWVPHYHCTPINATCIHQLLTLVHDGVLWLGGPIPITDMLIQRLAACATNDEVGHKRTSYEQLVEEVKHAATQSTIAVAVVQVELGDICSKIVAPAE